MSGYKGRYPLVGSWKVMDNLPQAILLIDIDDRVRFSNQAAGALLAGDGPSASIENTTELSRLVGPLRSLEGAPIGYDQLPWSRLARGESFRDYELRADLCKSNHRPVLSFGGKLVEDDDSGLLRVLTVDDATQRHESERLFRTVFERGPVPVTLVRSADQCVVDANAAFLDLLGYQRSEVVGHTVPDLAILLDDENLRGASERLARGEEVERVELIMRGSGNSLRNLLSWHRWVEINGEDCLLGVYVDITEQKEMERKLRDATQIVLQSASMFSRSVVQQLERLRAPDRASAVSGELDLLTRREREVVIRMGAGHSNKRIAGELDLTPQTVRNYVTRIYRKIGVTNRAEAVVWARERGLVQD